MSNVHTEILPELQDEKAIEKISIYYHALLVEDNFFTAHLTEKLLRKLGLFVTIASNGVEAIEAVYEKEFHIIFMDYHMPVMNGVEATKAIKALNHCKSQYIPIVALTAVLEREEFFQAGVDDYLCKPAKLADIRTILERWLR
ncbi:response regulator [Heliorestis convoluta]|uniref:Stage 0 sporulation protein A homolog n=1 Tax=Heliorestis convoluta TaxID=356322 RepID=A0A5Q2MZ80_9FIRM|nr:response regulator [Heliorestis convoluta]QGG48284.1 signal transduction histidine kinase [Heliorestis convoluta]